LAIVNIRIDSAVKLNDFQSTIVYDYIS